MARLVVLVGALMAVASCAERRDATFAFTELTYPGATSTVAAGINAAGQVVGWYRQGDRTYGFVYADGNYTSVGYPDSTLTQLYGITAEGEVSGAYRKAGETQMFNGQPVAFHGFVRTKSGEFLEVRHPAHKYSMAQRILADGSVVGCYHDDDFSSMRGVTIPRHAMTPRGDAATADTESTITVVEAPSSMNNGATPDGTKVVGFLMESGQAYVIDRGALTTFGVPGAKSTEAWDISDSGVIVGVFDDSTSVTHGFMLEDAKFTTIDFPGARSTITFGINARGDIVGGFEGKGGERRGYVARRQ